MVEFEVVVEETRLDVYVYRVVAEGQLDAIEVADRRHDEVRRGGADPAPECTAHKRRTFVRGVRSQRTDV